MRYQGTAFDVRPEQVQTQTFDFDRLIMGDPTQARPTDPGTSHAAALRSVDSKRVSEAILTVLRDEGPMTDEWLHDRLTLKGYRWRDNRTRTVRAQLVRQGLVQDSGMKGVTSTGRKAISWEAIS